MDPVTILFIIFAIIFLIYKLKGPKRKTRDFRQVILYAADFLAKNRQEMTVHFNDVSCSELLKFIEKNSYSISNFKKIDDSAISFDVRIESKEYMIVGRKFISDELMLFAKAK